METNESKLQRDVRILKMYSVFMTLVCGTAALTAFTPQSRNLKFEEIDVERINIVEKDGKIRMVISNQERQHPGVIDGRAIPRPQPRPSGLIFFNHLGDEMGGLIFGDNGGNGHFGHLSFDKVRNDQTIGFRHLESDNGTYQAGMEVWQQPKTTLWDVLAKQEAIRQIVDEEERNAATKRAIENGELPTPRLFYGKTRDDSVSLLMSDIHGKPRIRMQVTAAGNPKLEFLDNAERVIYSLP